MSFDTMLGGQSPKTGNAEPTILYAPDGTTALKVSSDSGAGKALAVTVWDSVLNDFVKVYGDGSMSVTAKWDVTNKGQNSNNPLFVTNPLVPSIGIAQTALHSANTIILPAAGIGLRNIITNLQCAARGTGTAPNQTSPVTITIKDGTNIIYLFTITSFSNNPILAPSGGVGGTPNTSMTISVTDAGANNSTDINMAYQVG